jgi:hypothetical protein
LVHVANKAVLVEKSRRQQTQNSILREFQLLQSGRACKVEYSSDCKHVCEIAHSQRFNYNYEVCLKTCKSV